MCDCPLSKMGNNLQVQSMTMNPRENAICHRTNEFELTHDDVNPIPVLRRGFKFTMAFTFDRNYIKGHDNVKIILNFGTMPSQIKGTKCVIRLDDPMCLVESNALWRGRIVSEEGNTITVEISIPPDCPVGIWRLQVVTIEEKSIAEATIYDYQNDIYILFNPWCGDDLVYMADEPLLNEYILCDVGKIWIGPVRTAKGRVWAFGQFDACVLPAVMFMLNVSMMNPSSRGDPISVSRMISKMVNSNDDDNGIIRGGWDGNYVDGFSPSSWTGSVEILHQYLVTRDTVCYGQCWVFAGVVTTICRALGIPSRVVTNFVSAHDANASLSIDMYYSANGTALGYDPINPEGQDSIWNYHVWSDVWMARPDLPIGYGGWQAIDSTPQEKSGGIYQCGPASLEAIKNGAVGFNYDVGFMVASVNADLMRWKENPKSDWGYSKIYCNKRHIGRLILTKGPFLFDPYGEADREDITSQYKYREGTESERLSLYNAVRGTASARWAYFMPDTGLEQLYFELQDLDIVKFGDDFSVTVTITNNGETERNVKVTLNVASVFYNGIKAHEVKYAEGGYTMGAQSSEILRMVVTVADYTDKLVEYCIMKVHAIASVSETLQTWADEDDFQIIKPTIDIRVPTEIQCRQPVAVTLRFVNPLHIPLTYCKFNLSGPTLFKNLVLPYPDTDVGGLLKIETEIVLRIGGEQKLIATFDSRELVDVTGVRVIDVINDNLMN